jgi:glycosyltransferase involved in cell wall biosynthesis
MKLLMVLPSSRAGGHQTNYSLAIANAAQSKGWCIDLVTPADGLHHPNGLRLAEVIRATGGSVLDVPDTKQRTLRCARFLGYLEAQWRRWAWIREAGLAARCTRQHDIAYVDGGDGWYLPYSLLGSPIRNVPIVTVMLRIRYHHRRLAHGAGQRMHGALLQRLLVKGFLARQSLAAVITVDRPWASLNSVEAAGGPQKVYYAPDMGTTITLMDRTLARKQLGIEADRRVILCLGSMDRRKGVAELLNAISHEACPVTIGALVMGANVAEGAVATDLARTLAQKHRLWVRNGAYGNDELAIALSAADAVWLGYRGHSFSSSILWEAAQTGLPVLGCHTGLIAWEIRSQQLGEVVDIDDTEAVALALARLMNHEQLRATWRENGMRAGAGHTAERFGGAVIKTLVNAARGFGAHRYSPGLPDYSR